MIFKKSHIKTFLVTLFSIFLFSLVIPIKVGASCGTSNPRKEYGTCGETCTSFTHPTTGVIWSSGETCYSCGTDNDGYYCWKHAFLCDHACSGGGGGGGGGFCPGGTITNNCTKITNCKASSRGDHCGWSTSHPVVEKVLCKKCKMPSCDTSAPTNLVLDQTSSNSWRLSWTKGSNGTLQYVYVGSVKSGVESDCPDGSGCVVNDENVDKDTTSYNMTGLAGGTVYYAKVVTYKDDECSSDSSTLTDLSSCDLVGGSLNIQQGQSVNFVTNINNSSDINRVDYSVSSPTNSISINPITDNTYIYQTVATGVRNGPASITSQVYLGSGAVMSCIDSVTVHTVPSGPWWQVKDSDVQSAGDLTSVVPSIAGTFFGLPGPGGFPGVSSYGGTTNLTGANVSSTGWLADSPVTNSRVYNYAYFTNQIPSDILSIINNVNGVDVPGSLNSGSARYDTNNNYYWYKYDGAMNAGQPLTIPTTNIGTRKVILLVDNANVNITGNINLTDGQGFFMLIVRGSINVNPTVGGGASPNLEGLYFADTTFTDGVGNTQLTTRGSIVANGGISMLRDLDDNTPPSELFEYAPDQIMLFPKIIGTRKMEWKEVAP